MFKQINFVLIIICANGVYAIKTEGEYDIDVRYSPEIREQSKKFVVNRKYKYQMTETYPHNLKYHKDHYGINHQSNEIIKYLYPQLYGKPIKHQIEDQAIQSTKESVMEALFLLAKNDDLQCVPKILCDMALGMASGRQSTLNLPVNVNLESILSFLSSLKGVGSSPLIYFSAALLGYTSRGNPGQCSNTFTKCPSDPDKLVQYLNQHNGGFFRFFNGVDQSIKWNTQNIRRAKKTSHSYAPYHRDLSKITTAEKRIQTRPSVYIPLTSDFADGAHVFDFEDPRKDRHPKDLRFPPEVNDVHFFEPTVALHLPQDDQNYGYSHTYRRPKELHYDLEYNENDLDLQRPLPNHRPSSTIFPVRTGTGELKLDAEELNAHHEPIYFDEQGDNTRIKFQSELENGPGYNGNEKYRDEKLIFTFPS